MHGVVMDDGVSYMMNAPFSFLSSPFYFYHFPFFLMVLRKRQVQLINS